MAEHGQTINEQAERPYYDYGRPLENEHRGEYVAVSADGKTLLGTTLLGVVQRASATFGPGNFVFKVGEKAVGRWR